MNYINPHEFSAILDGITHRFILIHEFECLSEPYNSSIRHPPRFSIGGYNALKDPRQCSDNILVEITVGNKLLFNIPFHYLVHQFIYMIHSRTDAYGWQYRSSWIQGPLKSNDEPWSGSMQVTSTVRRRIWLSTLVNRIDLMECKRLLASYLQRDNKEFVRLQGELLHYVPPTSTTVKAWVKKKIFLYNNRIEIQSSFTHGDDRMTLMLTDCEVELLFETQIPGRSYVFCVRNASTGSTVLLDAETRDYRRNWFLSIQYQIAVYSKDLNFAPFEYGPPLGPVSYPDNRIMYGGYLNLEYPGSLSNTIRYFELTPRELRYYVESKLMGKVFIQDAELQRMLDSSSTFAIKSSTGITLTLIARSVEVKNEWTAVISAQIQYLDVLKKFLDNYSTTESQQHDYGVPMNLRIAQYYEDVWSSSHRFGSKDEVYIRKLLGSLRFNDRESSEFTDYQRSVDMVVTKDGGLKEGLKTVYSKHDSRSSAYSTVISIDGDMVHNEESNAKSIMMSQRRIENALRQSIYSSEISCFEKVNLSSRSLITPNVIINALQDIQRRFLLIMESEYRVSQSSIFQEVNSPPRFTVGTDKANKDPRTTPLSDLFEISNQKPINTVPQGWVLVHQFIYFIGSNTDDYGWQYRSKWSNGSIDNKDEPWADSYDEKKHHVRRRLWMTTVVKQDDVINAKKMMYGVLNDSASKDIVLVQGSIYYLDTNHQNVNWLKAKILLYHKKIEFYVGNTAKGEVQLDSSCKVSLLFKSQCNGKENAFHIQNADNQVLVTLMADNDEDRLKWVRCIEYQIAILHWGLNFPPFIYGPPAGFTSMNCTLFCGDLLKDNQTPLHFQLRPTMLLAFQKGKLIIRLNIEQAYIQYPFSEPSGIKFTMKFMSGYVMTMYADSPEMANTWAIAIKRQVMMIESNEKFFNSYKTSYPAEISDQYDLVSKYRDPNWNAPVADFATENTFISNELNNLIKLSSTELYDGTEHPYNPKMNLSMKKNKSFAYEFEASSKANVVKAKTTNIESKSMNASSIAMENSTFHADQTATRASHTTIVLADENGSFDGQVGSPFSRLNEASSALVDLTYSRDEMDDDNAAGYVSPTKGSNTFQNINLMNRTVMNHMKFKDLLKGLNCRFIVVMESEYRSVEPSAVNSPPRFTIGGSKASLDPKKTKLSDLVEITMQKPLNMLPIVVHQFIYLVYPNTDDFGWQYRSKWADGIKDKDEQWTALFDEKKHFVRRRLWFTSKVNDTMKAKQLLHSELTSEKREEVIAQGLISFLDLSNNKASNDWQRMKILLRYDVMELFVDNEAPPIALVLDSTCKLYMLNETNSFGKEYVFKLRNMDDSIHCIIGFDSDDDRLNWLRCIEYQIALLYWGLTFPSFACGPPTEMTHIVLSGDLLTVDNNNNNNPLHFQLKPTMLLAFEKENLVLRLNIEYAVVHDDDESPDDGFIIVFISGYKLRLRSDLTKMRDCWVSAIRRQVLHIENNDEFFDSFIEQSDFESKYRDRNWNSLVDNNATHNSYLKDELQALKELSKTEYYDGEMHVYIAKMNQSGKYHPSSNKTTSIRAVDLMGNSSTIVGTTSTTKNITTTTTTTLTSDKAHSTSSTNSMKKINNDKDSSTVKKINNKFTSANNYSSMLVERSLVSESTSESSVHVVTSNESSAHHDASTMKSTEQTTQSVLNDDDSVNQLNASENILAKKDMSVIAFENASDVVVDIVASDATDFSLKNSSPIKIEAPIRTPLKSPLKSSSGPVSFKNKNEFIVPVDSYESNDVSGSLSLLISTPESTNSPYSKPIDFLSVTTVGDHLTPPRSPYTNIKTPSAVSQSSLPPSASSEYTPVDEEAPERNIVRRRSRVYESGGSSITSEKQLDSQESNNPIARIIVSEKVKAFNERSMGMNTSPPDRSNNVPEVQVITRSSVAEKAKLFNKGNNNMNDHLNDNSSELNHGRKSKNKKEKGIQDRWNKAGPGSIDTNYTNYTNYNFESPDVSISRSIVSERLKIFDKGNNSNSNAVVSPKAAAATGSSKSSSKFKSSSGSSIQSTTVEVVKTDSVDVSRDIESAVSPITVSNSKVKTTTATTAAAAVVVVEDIFETTERTTSSEIVIQAVETPTAKPTESALPTDTTQDMMSPEVVAAGKTKTSFSEVTIEEASKINIMESSTTVAIGKSIPSLLTPKKSSSSSPVTQLVSPIKQVRALDTTSSGVDDKTTSPSTTAVKLATIKPLVRPTFIKPLASKSTSDSTPVAVDTTIVDPMKKLTPVKTLIKPVIGFSKIVDKSASDVVQTNDKPSSDANKPTVIRRFEKITTAQTLSSSVAVATTTTTTTTTATTAKVIDSRISRLSSVKGRIEGIEKTLSNNTVLEATQ